MDSDLSDFYAELASIDQNDAQTTQPVASSATPPPPPGFVPPPTAAVIGPSGPPPGFEGTRASAPIGPSMPPPGVTPPPSVVKAAPVDPNSIAAKLAALKAAKEKKSAPQEISATSSLLTPVPPPPMRPGPPPGFGGASVGPPVVAPPAGPPRVAPPRPPGMPGPPIVVAPPGFAGPPVVAGFMGVPVPPAPADSKGGKGEKSKFFREAAGKVWADPSLSDWPENDFRIFVGNLAQDVTDDILAKAFSKYTSFNRAKVVKNRKNSKTKGYGFVSFSDGADMLLALREMNNKYVGSRPVQLKRSDWKDRGCEAGEAEKRLRDQQAQGGQAKKRKRYHLPTVHLKDG